MNRLWDLDHLDLDHLVEEDEAGYAATAHFKIQTLAVAGMYIPWVQEAARRDVDAEETEDFPRMISSAIADLEQGSGPDFGLNISSGEHIGLHLIQAAAWRVHEGGLRAAWANAPVLVDIGVGGPLLIDIHSDRDLACWAFYEETLKRVSVEEGEEPLTSSLPGLCRAYAFAVDRGVRVAALVAAS